MATQKLKETTQFMQENSTAVTQVQYLRRFFAWDFYYRTTVNSVIMIWVSFI